MTCLPESWRERNVLLDREAEPHSPGVETALSASAPGEAKEIRRMVARLRGNRRVREWLVPDAARCGYGAQAFRSLMATLKDYSEARWRERIVAVWMAGHAPLTQEQKTTAAVTVGKILGRRDASIGERLESQSVTAFRRSIVLSCVTFFVITLLLACRTACTPYARAQADAAVIVILGSIVSLIAGLLASPFAMPLVLPFSIAADKHRLKRLRTMAARALRRLKVPETVGDLARGALEHSRTVSQRSLEALQEVLPTLTAQHYGCLGAEASPALCEAMVHFEGGVTNHTGQEEDLVVQLLEGLEKVGDGRAVREVERIAHRGHTERVRSVAQKTLPILLARREREQHRDLLLRASSEEGVGATELLRSVTQSAASEPLELLRPITYSDESADTIRLNGVQ